MLRIVYGFTLPPLTKGRTEVGLIFLNLSMKPNTMKEKGRIPPAPFTRGRLQPPLYPLLGKEGKEKAHS